MRDHISFYVKPVYEDYKIVGWTWEKLHNNKLVDYGQVPQPTISAAREEALCSTRTIGWDMSDERNGGGEHAKGFSKSVAASGRGAR